MITMVRHVMVQKLLFGCLMAVLVPVTCVKGGVNLDHFGGAKVDQLVKG